jgi:hypothetical protein
VRRAAWVLAVALGGCLPADNRPEPTSVRVIAAPSEATASGFTTGDGWAVHFERLVTALGDVRLDAPQDRADDACNAYSETRYEWLYDFAAADREKVGLAFGIGTCSVSWRARGPSRDTVLGAGATEADKTTMRVEASDAYAEDSRATLVVRGTATRGTDVKRFEWTFRRGYQLDRCPAASGDGFANVLELRGGEAVELAIEVRGEELFRRGPDDAEPLRFDGYAAADEDQDGELTLEELAAVDAPADVQSDGTGGAGGGSQGPPPIVTLADLVYVELLPRVTRVHGGGACEAEARGRR